jgi:Flp pilus assembly pilin Flp
VEYLIIVLVAFLAIGCGYVIGGWLRHRKK